jgi:hypothetical protein
MQPENQMPMQPPMPQANPNMGQAMPQQQTGQFQRQYQQYPQQSMQGQMPQQGQMMVQQQQPMPPIKQDPNSTQGTLLFSELRDSMIIMKDGSFRAVIACKSINFDLMSEAEREGVERSYQDFLNSLTFTTQIMIRSQRVDIGPYLEHLASIRRNTDNMLLGVLMDDYIDFIDYVSQEANIMDKSFFIIIPYFTNADAEKSSTQVKGIFSGLFGNKNNTVTKIDRATYDNAVKELNNRVELVTSGLFNMGIHSVRLNTKELSELFYNFNNPDTAVREPFIDFSKLATTYVKKGPKPQGGIQ